jgi:hypothetical protein
VQRAFRFSGDCSLSREASTIVQAGLMVAKSRGSQVPISTEYFERARLGEAPIFQVIKHRPYGRGQAELTGERPPRRLSAPRGPAQGCGLSEQADAATYGMSSFQTEYMRHANPSLLQIWRRRV